MLASLSWNDPRRLYVGGGAATQLALHVQGLKLLLVNKFFQAWSVRKYCIRLRSVTPF